MGDKRNINKTSYQTSEIKVAVDEYVKHLESLSETYPLVTVILRATSFAASNKSDEFLKTKAKAHQNDKGEDIYSIPFENISKFARLRRNADNSELAHKIIPRNFIVSLVSQFDAFIGQLIRAIFLIKPELLNSSEKNLSFSKLLELQNIEEAREFLIDKEVETVLRDSHFDQIKWLEKKLDVTLQADLPSSPTFIEVTERRNLFVHSNGIVSSQYLSVCKIHKVDLGENTKAGSELKVTDEYFLNAYRCLFEIGVKLSQVAWRKLCPQDNEGCRFQFNKYHLRNNIAR